MEKINFTKYSYLSILKLIPIVSNGEISKPLFYFRILVDYQFRSIVHPKLSVSSTELEVIEREKKVAKRTPSREGAQKYRKKVIEHMPQCPLQKYRTKDY